MKLVGKNLSVVAGFASVFRTCASSTWLKTGVSILAASMIVLVASTTGVTAATSSDVTTNLNKTTVINDYQNRLEPLLSVPTGWTGNVETCKAGTTSTENQKATLSAVNYIRGLAALKPVKLNPTQSKQAQKSALIQSASGWLSHTPDKSSACWTKGGFEGASHGNLFLSSGYDDELAPSTGARAVVGYMEDSGGNNIRVGHRRWILFSGLKTIGSGDTDNANTLVVISPKYTPQRGSTFTPWPTAGYFPRELEPLGRWSLTSPNSNFTKAKVTVTTPDGPVKINQHCAENGYGDNTLVWDMELPEGYRTDPIADYPVEVKVTGIRLPNGSTVKRAWTTTLVHAGVAPPSSLVPPPDENTSWTSSCETFFFKG